MKINHRSHKSEADRILAIVSRTRASACHSTQRIFGDGGELVEGMPRGPFLFQVLFFSSCIGYVFQLLRCALNAGLQLRANAKETSGPARFVMPYQGLA